MSRLTSAQRGSLKYSQFALPGRRYPIENKSHAQNARARVMQFGTMGEKRAVFAKTAKFFN